MKAKPPGTARHPLTRNKHPLTCNWMKVIRSRSSQGGLPTWSMLTLALVAYIGWKWFDGFVGVVAGVLFAASAGVTGLASLQPQDPPAALLLLGWPFLAAAGGALVRAGRLAGGQGAG